MERPPGKDMWQRGNGEKVVMREYDNENMRDDVGTHQYEKPRRDASEDRLGKTLRSLWKNMEESGRNCKSFIIFAGKREN